MNASGGATGVAELAAVISAAGLGGILVAWLTTRGTRVVKALEVKQAEQHDVLVLRQHLDSIGDGRTKMAFEMLTAICQRQDDEIKRLEVANDALEADNEQLKDHKENCEQRLSVLEKQAPERGQLTQELKMAQQQLRQTLSRIIELERTIRDGGLSVPPFGP